MQKHRILLINFEALEGGAISGFLGALGDFDIKTGTFIEFAENKTAINADLIIFRASEAQNSLDEDIDIPVLYLFSANQASKDFQNSMKTPFRLNDLETKIRTILRRKEDEELKRLEIKGLKYNAARHSLISKNGKQIKLTDKEIDILLYLSRLNEPASREELLRDVWHYNEGVTTHTLETHIYRLRQKLSQLLEDEEVLLTNDGGYYLDK